MAVCGMRCIDLNIDTLKILGIYFSYYKDIRELQRKIETGEKFS